MRKLRLAPWQLSVTAAAYITLADNARLFSAISTAIGPLSLRGASFIVAVALIVFLVLNALFLGLGGNRFLKPVITVLLVATAVFGYFSSAMGVVFDEEMLLNMLDTIVERNYPEAAELVSLPLLLHVLVFGILPASAMVLVEVDSRRFLSELASRVGVIATCVAALAIIVMPNFQYITFFATEHRDLRFAVMPVYPVVSLFKLVRDAIETEPTFTVIDADADRFAVAPKRSVGIMVVGETARADHFSLGGYTRQTNPVLAREPDLLFFRAQACGTSTRYSVPCMFSLRGRDEYQPELAPYESNVLDVLTSAGVRTVWIENNSGCKHVCDRAEIANPGDGIEIASPYYSDGSYMDEVLLGAVDEYLGKDGPDTLIVLHTAGSHGPAYSHRFPEDFAKFLPYCDQASPTECSPADVVNAYDNTILYTDHVLGALIDKLKARSEEIDSFFFYASDHGESLGESGIYLHGLPYAVAPDAQKTVPIVVWMSPGFRRDYDIDLQLAHSISPEPVSHDNISHTLLGLFNVRADSYREGLDMFAKARSQHQAPGGGAATAGAAK